MWAENTNTPHFQILFVYFLLISLIHLMYEIATLKSKNFLNYRKLPNPLESEDLPDSKMELIYQIIDTVAASPLEVKDHKPPKKGNIDSVAKVNEQTMQDKKAMKI